MKKSANTKQPHQSSVPSSSETLPEARLQYHIAKHTAPFPLLRSENTFTPRKIGILGAGMMGSGIAYEAARAGMKVILKDVSPDAARNGKSYAEKVASKLVQKNRLSESDCQQLLDRIRPTANMEDLSGVDVIIEAVFEDYLLKTQVIQDSLPYLNPNGIFASNTTSLPISRLADASVKPENFIGMHFFSPVDRMALVEVIRGKKTSEKTLEKALHVVYTLNKVPIVVNDGPAFFTSRIFFNYLLESITMLLEGIPAERIEDAAREAHFATGPFVVLDEISLELMVHVYDQLPKLHPAQQRARDYLGKLIRQGRGGRKAGKGFYEYPDDNTKKQIWNDPDLRHKTQTPNEEEIKQRLLHVIALDSYRCLDEGILTRPIDGDIGSVLGIGHPPRTGGVFSYIDQVGLLSFVENCLRFSGSGEQWEIPESLLQLAKKNFTFYTGLESNWEKRKK